MADVDAIPIAGRHPHCLGLIDPRSGRRVDLADEWAPTPVAQREYAQLVDCEHLDTAVTAWPSGWSCPRCGGTEFDWVRPD